jgi:hypothetical protein
LKYVGRSRLSRKGADVEHCRGGTYTRGNIAHAECPFIQELKKAKNIRAVIKRSKATGKARLRKRQFASADKAPWPWQ